MPTGPPLPPEELVRLRRMVGLPDQLPGEQLDGDDAPLCECGCGWPVNRQRNGVWATWRNGHHNRARRRR